MTPTDALNAFDGPLAATKPPEDLAARSTANASRTRRAPALVQRQPGARSIMAVRAAKPPRFDPLDSPAHITGAIRSP